MKDSILENIKKSNNPEQVLFNMKKKNLAKQLLKWVHLQKWTRDDLVSYEIGIRGMKDNEIVINIHGSDFDINDVNHILETTDFKNIELEYKGFEQTPWNKWSYFLKFKIK